MAAYRRMDDLWSPAGWLPVHRDQLRAQHSVSSMGSLFTLTYYASGVARIWYEEGGSNYMRLFVVHNIMTRIEQYTEPGSCSRN